MQNDEKSQEQSTECQSRYEGEDVNDKIIMNLRDLSHVMRSLYEGKGSQRRTLMVLNELGGTVTQRELTHRLGIQPGSVSEVAAKLENAGYIRRIPSEADRRITDIILTQEGKARAEEAKTQRIRRHEEMFSCLTQREKAELLEKLEKLNRDWSERYQGACEGLRKHGCGRHGRGSKNRKSEGE